MHHNICYKLQKTGTMEMYVPGTKGTVYFEY